MTIPLDEENWKHNLFDALHRRLPGQVFDTWFRPLRIGKRPDSRVLCFSAPNNVLKDWISSHYSGALEASLREVMPNGYEIEWSIDNSDASHAAELTTDLPTPVPGEHPDLKINPVARSGGLDALFNPKYTFDNFVVASCNQFAHAASQAVTDAPGKTYNPLYIYGGVGLGKTHLMQAIGHSIRRCNPSLTVSYTSLEGFMNALINAIRYGYDKTQAFRERYRSIDVLLVDDIQFIAGKERTQEEFFHTFNALYDSQKQIVISSDCPPRSIPDIEERLHSRFEWGLIADIEPPDLETKVAILRRKADLLGVSLPDDVALYMAGTVKHNIRELEGLLLRLLAISSLRGLPITKMLAQDAVGGINDSSKDKPSIPIVQKAVAAYYKMKVEDLTAKSNARSVALPRQIAMYLSKRLTKNSYPEIGRQFGGKHHTTVIHSVVKIEKLISSDPRMHRVVSGLVDSICK